MRFYLFLLVLLFLTLSACTSEESTTSLSPDQLVGQVSVVLEQESSSVVELQVTEGDWFQSNAQLLASWELNAKQGSNQLPFYELRPKPDTFSDRPQYRLLFLYTKESPFFDQSVTDILSVFVEQQLSVSGFVFLSEEPQSVDNILREINHKIDLIFTMGSDATAFIHDNHQNGPIPVVTVLSKDPVLLGQVANYEQGSGSHIAYTSVGVPIGVQIAYFQQLVPGLKHIAVLYATENKSAVETQVEPLRPTLSDQKITLIDVAVQDRTMVSEELERLMPTAISQMRQNDPELKQSIFLLTGSSSLTEQLGTIDALAEEIPIVTLLPSLVQEDEISPVFGIGVNIDRNSRLAANYALNILQKGTFAGDLPVGVITPPDLAINFAKARQIDLKMPFYFFETASTIYGPDGKAVRVQGEIVP